MARRFKKLAGLMIVAGAAVGGCTTTQATRDRVVQSPARCEDQTVQIYFEPDSAEVTAEGRAVIAQASASARGCAVKRVDVLGLADAAGTPETNLELSKRRAQSVTAALANAGLPDAEFQVAALGQAGALSPEGEARPLRRRVDVVLRLRPKP